MYLADASCSIQWFFICLFDAITHTLSQAGFTVQVPNGQISAAGAAALFKAVVGLFGPD